jgi:threonine dehydratase
LTATADSLPHWLQVQTPLEEAKQLSAQLGNTVLLKREDMQQVIASMAMSCLAGLCPTLGPWHTVCALVQVFSFKLRGAFNKMAQLTPEELARGVITSSAGNHAQGVALAASHLVSGWLYGLGAHAALPAPWFAAGAVSCSIGRFLHLHRLWSRITPFIAKVCCRLQGCEALICMPVTTPQIKVDAVRRLGGTVQLVGESYTETQSHAWVRATAAKSLHKSGFAFAQPTVCGRSCIVRVLVCAERLSVTRHILPL